MPLPDYFWGDADYELLELTGLANWKQHTVAEIRMFGEIRGEQHEKTVRFVCDKSVNTYDELAESITWNCLYPWVESIIAAQDAANEPEVLP